MQMPGPRPDLLKLGLWQLSHTHPMILMVMQPKESVRSAMSSLSSLWAWITADNFGTKLVARETCSLQTSVGRIFTSPSTQGPRILPHLQLLQKKRHRSYWFVLVCFAIPSE